MLYFVDETLLYVRIDRLILIVVLSPIGSVSYTVETLTVLTMLLLLQCKFICDCFVKIEHQAVLMVVFLRPPEVGLKLRYLIDLPS